MGHSMGGAGTCYLGGKYNDIWAGLAPLSGAGGIADGAAERFKSLPVRNSLNPQNLQRSPLGGFSVIVFSPPRH